MAPIEVVFGIIVLIFACIGLGRGFLKELGTTTVMMVLLFFLSRFDPYLDRGMTRGIAALSSSATGQDVLLVKCLLLVFVVAGAAFTSYHGETLAFGGVPPRGVQGVALGLLTGSLNGYLIGGSIWYFMDKFGYPIGVLGFSPELLSATARRVIEYLPLNFLAQPVLLGESLLLYLSAMLVIARVAR